MGFMFLDRLKDNSIHKYLKLDFRHSLIELRQLPEKQTAL